MQIIGIIAVKYFKIITTGSSGQVGLVLSDDSLFYGRIATGEILKVAKETITYHPLIFAL